MSEGQTPKIIVDSDWKSQARQEKEKLSEKTAAAASSPAKGPDAPVGMDDLIGWLATQALMYLGYFPDPQTGQAVVSVEYAKLYIDMLGVLETKTKGNLTEQEQQGLTKALTQLRAEFVEVSKALAKAIQEGKIRPMSRPGAAGPGVVAPPASGPNLGGITSP
jgi:hypothetical protein